MALSQPNKGRTLLSRLQSVTLERLKGVFIADGGRAHLSSNTGACSGSGQAEFSKWRKIDSRKLGIARSMISLPSWVVLKNLRDADLSSSELAEECAGFEAYLVGGCVRDLLLNKVPKDFDVITTATLQKVKKKFHRAIIVGQRFPICRVIIKGCLVEVSSFETVAGKSRKKQVSISQMPKDCDPGDFLRWKNCMNRDFTVNSLFFDPFLNVIFDYTNAMTDLRSLKLRTVLPAHLSFKEDEARILRGLRLAARLNLSFSKETEDALYSLSSSVAKLNKARISLEINYMLSYGAAEPSLLLLKRFKLLEIFLPFQAAYLSEQVDNRLGLRSSMLMKLFFSLDQLITCDRPCNDIFWVAVLAFNLALFSNPQHAVVVLTIASLLHGRAWEEGIQFARENARSTRIFVPEILDASDYLSDDEIAERVTQFARQVQNAVNVLTDKDCLEEAMTRFPESPCSGMVFVSQKMGNRVKGIFEILAKDVASLKPERRTVGINHSLLTDGDICETRFVLGKIVWSTLVYRRTGERGLIKDENDDMQVMSSPQELVLEEIRNASTRFGNLESMDKDGMRISKDNHTKVKVHHNASSLASLFK